MMQYCDEGTAPLNGGLIEVQVDTLLVVDSASSPLVYSNGNQYYYQADTLGLFDCSTLTVHFIRCATSRWATGPLYICLCDTQHPLFPFALWDESY